MPISTSEHYYVPGSANRSQDWPRPRRYRSGTIRTVCSRECMGARSGPRPVRATVPDGVQGSDAAIVVNRMGIPKQGHDSVGVGS